MVTGLDVFKAVAWLDLTVKREAGDKHAYSKVISKLKNDIARIVATFGERDYGLPGGIKAKMREFMARYRSEALDPPVLGIALEADDIKARLAACMGIS